MSAPHLFASSVAEDEVVIEDDDAHHAVRVLRLRPGERVTISDGEGNVADATVVRAGGQLVARVEARRHVRREPPALTVLQGIPKAGKLDVVVQKLTELGVDELIPLQAGRSVARWDDPRKQERLAVIAREAAKQSRRAWLPVVRPPVRPATALTEGLTLVLHEEAGLRLRDALPPRAPDRITLVVGPEGGLDAEEVEMFVKNGGQAVSLGPTILRTETAALVAATLILGRYGRLG